MVPLRPRDKYFELGRPIWNASDGAETTQAEQHPSVPVCEGLLTLVELHNLSTLQLPRSAEDWCISRGEDYRVHNCGPTDYRDY